MPMALPQPTETVRYALSGRILTLGVAVAGALGALSRWGLGQRLATWGAGNYPWGTLAANLSGCFLLGLVMSLGNHARWMSEDLRMILAVGFIGSLTTFSTWEFETLNLVRGGEMLLAAGNLAVNVFFGFVLIWAGLRLGAAWMG